LASGTISFERKSLCLSFFVNVHWLRNVKVNMCYTANSDILVG